jgi:transposase InsO family protein
MPTCGRLSMMASSGAISLGPRIAKIRSTRVEALSNPGRSAAQRQGNADRRIEMRSGHRASIDVAAAPQSAPSVPERTFQASAPNRKWIADFRYVWTAEGWLSVAAVIDFFSRRVVGWSLLIGQMAALPAIIWWYGVDLVHAQISCLARYPAIPTHVPATSLVDATKADP